MIDSPDHVGKGLESSDGSPMCGALLIQTKGKASAAQQVNVRMFKDVAHVEGFHYVDYGECILATLRGPLPMDFVARNHVPAISSLAYVRRAIPLEYLPEPLAHFRMGREILTLHMEVMPRMPEILDGLPGMGAFATRRMLWRWHHGMLERAIVKGEAYRADARAAFGGDDEEGEGGS